MQNGCLLKLLEFSKAISQLTQPTSNTRHVCTYLNAFSMVVPNIVTNSRIVTFFTRFLKVLDVSSGHARSIVISLISIYL